MKWPKIFYTTEFYLPIRPMENPTQRTLTPNQTRCV